MTADERIRIGLLGPLTAHRGEATLLLGGSKQRAVLALLALERGRSVPTDTLIDALWVKDPPGRPQTAIQGYVSQLRKALGQDAIVTDLSGYRLGYPAAVLDSVEFEDLLSVAERLLPAAKAAKLAEALGLWRGPVLADFSYESWAQAEIARLEDLRLAALESRLDAELECGRAGELVGELEALVQGHPLRERLRGQLMLALYRAGRQADALEAYTAARSALVDELGIDPGPELQELHRSILNQDAALAAEAPVVPTIRLPLPATPLVGRDEEMAGLMLALAKDGVRLVTVTGPGGIGKTRLAIEAAANLAPAFPDGVWFVELAALREPVHVLPAIAAILDADGDLVTHIGASQMLLVLDNFEQVLEGAVALAEVCSRCPNVRVLATSRERLHLSGEVEVVLQPLEPGHAAALFAERAGRLGIEVDPEAEEVGELCKRLDGLPLAIELAAARARLFTPRELLERLGNQLELLSAGPLDAPKRHRTLAATIEWSYALLNDGERELFEGLAVFAGPFDLADVEAVLPTDLETLAGLVDKSLLVRRSEEIRRFGLLATVREFASAHLEERAGADAIRRRHAEHVLTEVRHADDLVMTPRETAALAEIARRHDDIRAALDWAENVEDHELALELATVTGWFWYIRDHLAEGSARLGRALNRSEPTQSKLRARALNRAGLIADGLGNFSAANQFYRQALAIHRHLGNRQGEFDSLTNLSALSCESGDYVTAGELMNEAVVLARGMGVESDVATALGNLAYLRLLEQDADGALPLLEESVTHWEAVGNTHELGVAHGNLGAALVSLRQYPRAARALAESIAHQRVLGAMEMLPSTIESLAALAVATGDPITAAQRLGAAVAIRTGAGRGVRGDEQRWVADTESGAREALGDNAFEQAFDAGRRLPLADAFEFAEREASAALAQAPAST